MTNLIRRKITHPTYVDVTFGRKLTWKKSIIENARLKDMIKMMAGKC